MSFLFGKKEREKEVFHKRSQSDKQTAASPRDPADMSPPVSPTSSQRGLKHSDHSQSSQSEGTPKPTRPSVLPEQPSRPKPKKPGDQSLKSSIEGRDKTAQTFLKSDEMSAACWEFGSSDEDGGKEVRKPQQVEITLASPGRSPPRDLTATAGDESPKTPQAAEMAPPSQGSPDSSPSPLSRVRQRPVSEIMRPVNSSTSSESVGVIPLPLSNIAGPSSPSHARSPASPSGSAISLLERSSSRKSTVGSSATQPAQLSPPRRPVPSSTGSGVNSASGSFLSRSSSATAGETQNHGQQHQRPPSVPVLPSLPATHASTTLSARTSTSGSFPRHSRDDPSLTNRLLAFMSPRSSLNMGKEGLATSQPSQPTTEPVSPSGSVRSRSSTTGGSLILNPGAPDPLATRRREGELDTQDLLSKLRDPNCSLEVRDRKKGLRTVRRAFVGAQFVDWLLQNGFTKTGTRAEAVAIASALLNSNDLEAKSDDLGPVFHDGPALYALPKGKDPFREKRDEESDRTATPPSPGTNPLTGSTRGLSSTLRGKMWGASLTDIMERDPDLGSNGKLPRILPMLMHAVVVLGGSKTEGIFRLSPEQSALDALRESLERGATAIACTDPHVPAAALKTFLRDLKHPVVPDANYPACIKYCEDPREGPLVVEAMAEPNRTVMKELIVYLREIAAPENVTKTKMSMPNIATVFAPCLLRCPSTSPAEIMRNSILEQLWLQNVLENIDLKDYKSLL